MLQRFQSPLPPRRLAVAPMMNRTDRHFRYLMRLITRHTWLYSEMVVGRALVHGDPGRLLRHAPDEGPAALQVGGSEPDVLAVAARLAEEHGYNEINLNIGCPSPRVTAGRMGACLMAEPGRVAECVAAMRDATRIPVTVKTRLGIDRQDSFDFLVRFTEAVARVGCGTLIVHARKAWLEGLDPKANRNVPVLDYERVRRLKQAYPELEILVNGGIADLDEAEAACAGLDGAMLGRSAYARPMLFAEADARFFGDPRPGPAVGDVVARYLEYLREIVAAGDKLGPALRHLPGVISGIPGSRAMRSRLGALAGTRDVAAAAEALAPLLARRAA